MNTLNVLYAYLASISLAVFICVLLITIETARQLEDCQVMLEQSIKEAEVLNTHINNLVGIALIAWINYKFPIGDLNSPHDLG